MNKPTKKIPRFASEAEERAFWESQDSTDYLDWTQAQSVVPPNLKPLTQAQDADLRLSQAALDRAAQRARTLAAQIGTRLVVRSSGAPSAQNQTEDMPVTSGQSPQAPQAPRQR